PRSPPTGRSWRPPCGVPWSSAARPTCHSRTCPRPRPSCSSARRPPTACEMRASAIAALGAASAWSLPALAPLVPPLCGALGVERRLEPARGAVALTFDDGPHPQGTPAVLEALERTGAVATFFLVGEQVERRPALAREITTAGHGIALHGHRHRNLLRVPPRALAEDLRRAGALIAEATGVAPRLYRPPYGIFSAAGLVLAERR